MFRASSTRLRWQAASVASGMALVLLAVLFIHPVKQLDFELQDLLLAVFRSEPSDEKIALVSLDERSLNLDGVLEPEELAQSAALRLMQSGFPWSREVYALAARRLLEAGAKVVIFDMLFTSPREGDAEFAQVLRDYPNRIVLGSSFERSSATQHSGQTYQYTPPVAELSAETEGVGFVNFPSGERNVVRTMWPYASASVLAGLPPAPDEKMVPALSTAAALRLGRDIPVTSEPRRFPYAKYGFFSTVPLYEIFVPALWEANYQRGKTFQDSIVLVGATAQHLQDYHQTPLGRIPGPVVQLHALSALMHGNWLGQAGLGVMMGSVFFGAAIALALLAVRRNVLWFVFGLMAGVLIWFLVCAIALSVFSYFLPMAPPLLTWLVCGFAGLACDVSLERRERGRLRSTLERYVSKDVVAEIVENPDSFLQTLGGQRKEIIALFSDLKGFTADAERLDPTEMVAMLNEYFGEMVEVVFSRQGTLDKFMGDALMATWGCIHQATPQEDACNAVQAALEMKSRLAALNAARTARNALPWSAGIGICQGPAVFGNIGSQQKMEPTVIGDTVNLASRVEGLTRVYGCDILVDARVAGRAQAISSFLLVDEVRVKGRRTPEKLFFPHDGSDPGWIAAFAAARALYLAGDFAAAGKAFARLTQTGPAPDLARRYEIRCEGFFRVLPQAGWDGVWDFVEK